MKKQIKPDPALVINPIDHYKTLQHEILDLMKMWQAVKTYDDRCFITRRISTLQNDALRAIRQARLEFESRTVRFRTVKD